MSASKESPRAQMFIGRLPKEVRRSELEDIFGKYGRVTRCDIRVGLETAYAFIDFDDHRDAKDAMKHENGREFYGQRMVVDWAIDDNKYGRFSKRAMAQGYRRPTNSGYPRNRSRSRSGSPPRRQQRRSGGGDGSPRGGGSDDRQRHRHRTSSKRSKSRSKSPKGGKANTNRSAANYRSRSRSGSR